MGTRYPDRPPNLNMEATMTVRLGESQLKRVESFAGKFHMSKSDIVREAISIWLNMNTTKEGGS